MKLWPRGVDTVRFRPGLRDEALRRALAPAVMVSHEAADGVLRTWGVPPAAAGRAADRLNTLSAHAYARIVCTTDWAEREFVRTGVRNVVRAPLGVDLERFRPGLRSTALRTRHLRGQDVLLLLGSRLPVEKRPGRALDAPAALRHTGVRAALAVAGDGPLRAELERRARAERLPAEFLGHVRDRDRLARLQASADLCLAPGPAETFGLPGPLRHPLARRQQAVNAVVRPVRALRHRPSARLGPGLDRGPFAVERGPAPPRRAGPPKAGRRLPPAARRTRTRPRCPARP